jgi:hypothetical protein
MTTHELAKKLLDGPDLPACVFEGHSPKPIEVGDIRQHGGDWYYRSESDEIQRGEHVTLS